MDIKQIVLIWTEISFVSAHLLLMAKYIEKSLATLLPGHLRSYNSHYIEIDALPCWIACMQVAKLIVRLIAVKFSIFQFFRDPGWLWGVHSLDCF